MPFKKVVLTLIGLVGICGFSAAQTWGGSSAADRQTVHISAYTGFGMVSETRQVQLQKGPGTLTVAGVPAYIVSESVRVRSVNQPDKLIVQEQVFEYDLLSPEKLLDRYVGKPVRLIVWNEYQDRKETVEAVLLGHRNGVIYEINGDVYLGHPGVRVLPGPTDGLVTEPSLIWQYENAGAASHTLELAYLTRNIGWSADYALTISPDGQSGTISVWATLDNRSGTSYDNVRLTLVAGEVHRAPEPAGGRKVMAMEAAAPSPSAVSAGSLSEYYRYDLKREIELKNNQTRQLRLFGATGIGLEREFMVRGESSGWMRSMGDEGRRQPVGVFIRLENTTANRMGMPLPAGTVRIYRQDEDQGSQFVGEDVISHTPRDETIRMKMGNAFDIVAERRQTDYRRLSARLHESAWEIRLVNRKAEPVTVRVVEPLTGNWTIKESSQPYEKSGAFEIRFDVDIPAGAETVVTYRISVGL